MALKDKCLVCSSSDVSFHLNCKDYFTSGEIFGLLKCNQCGFIFTENPPPESEIGKYYETGEYISHSDTKKGLVNLLFHYARSFMLYRKRNVIRKATGIKSGTLLDVGCGTGYFPAFMKRNRWKVSGLEVNEKAREYAKVKFDLDILTEKEFEDSTDNQYDCITLWHVLEHFHDPGKYLLKIRSLLKNKGVCIIAIPNTDSYDAGYFKSNWAAYDVPRHLWHFNPDNFRIYSEKSFFNIESIISLNLDVFYISILSEKYKDSKLPLIKGILRAIPFAFLSVFKIKKSSSVIYILRKLAD